MRNRISKKRNQRTSSRISSLKKLRKLKKKRGFTLVELMVVLVVLGGLMTILLVSLSGSGVNEKAAKLHLRASKAQIEMGLLQFNSTYGRYPRTDEGLDALVTAPPGEDSASFPAKGFVDKKFILDPWKNKYEYRNDTGDYQITSLGADGQPGGEGQNADVNLNTLE